MAITSLRPIKAKNRREVITKQDPTEKVGYTRMESRGVFGSYIEPGSAAAKRIDEYNRSKAELELRRAKPVGGAISAKGGNWERTPMERKRDELAELGIKVVGFKSDDGEVTYF